MTDRTDPPRLLTTRKLVFVDQFTFYPKRKASATSAVLKSNCRKFLETTCIEC